MHVYYYCTDSVDIGPTAYDFLQTFSFAIHDGIQQRKLRIRCHLTETSLFCTSCGFFLTFICLDKEDELVGTQHLF